MEPQFLLALLAASAVNAIIPGPGMMLAVGRSASRGFHAGIQVSFGMALATALLIAVVWSVTAGALILSETGLVVLRLAGIAVLVLLALVLVFATPSETVLRSGRDSGRFARGLLGDLVGGLVTGLTSPVHLLFLLALLPQFVDFAATSALELAFVTAAVVIITTIPMLAASAVGARTGRLGTGWARHVSRASGAVLLGFAALSFAATV